MVVNLEIDNMFELNIRNFTNGISTFGTTGSSKKLPISNKCYRYLTFLKKYGWIREF